MRSLKRELETCILCPAWQTLCGASCTGCHNPGITAVCKPRRLTAFTQPSSTHTRTHRGFGSRIHMLLQVPYSRRIGQNKSCLQNVMPVPQQDRTNAIGLDHHSMQRRRNVPKPRGRSRRASASNQQPAWGEHVRRAHARCIFLPALKRLGSLCSRRAPSFTPEACLLAIVCTNA